MYAIQFLLTLKRHELFLIPSQKYMSLAGVFLKSVIISYGTVILCPYLHWLTLNHTLSLL